jgi:hypothetical protein
MSAINTPPNGNAQKLLDMLAARAVNRKGHSVEEMSEELKITLGFFRQLQRGIRPLETIGDELAAEMAKYLDIPLEEVLFLAGKRERPQTNSPQKQSGRPQTPCVVVSIDSQGAVESYAEAGTCVLVLDRRTRENDHAIQVQGDFASLRSLLQGLAGVHSDKVARVAQDVLRGLEHLGQEAVTCELSEKERVQIGHLRKFLSARL